jgi:hypothetical protein
MSSCLARSIARSDGALLRASVGERAYNGKHRDTGVHRRTARAELQKRHVRACGWNALLRSRSRKMKISSSVGVWKGFSLSISSTSSSRRPLLLTERGRRRNACVHGATAVRSPQPPHNSHKIGRSIARKLYTWLGEASLRLSLACAPGHHQGSCRPSRAAFTRAAAPLSRWRPSVLANGAAAPRLPTQVSCVQPANVPLLGYAGVRFCVPVQTERGGR